MLTPVVRVNSNTRVPAPAGDLSTVVYDVAVAAGPNAYPLGGEPITFAAEFREAHDVVAMPAFAPAGPGMATSGASVVAFERDTTTTGRIRFYIVGAPGNLVEVPAGPYPGAFAFTLLVVGRPSTDGS